MFNIHRFREVGVTINVNTKGDNKLNNLSKLIESLDKQTNSVKSKMSNLKINIDTKQLEKTPDLLGRVEKGFRSLSLVRLTYLANGVRRVTSNLVDMVENAAGYEESLNLYRMALGQYVDAARTWSGELTDKLLIDETELMQSAGTFYNLARGLGVVSDNAYTMSKALTQLTYDMSSYLNISVEAANAKIQSAMSGQARAIQGVGVAIQAASLQELAYSLGIKKSVSEMTQAEKTYLRYIQLMKSTTHMQGDLARTMITPANSIRILKTQIHLLGRAIGQVLTPIIMNAIPWIMAFTDALTRLATWLANKLGYKIADVDYSTAFIDGADAVEDYGNAVQKAGNKVKRSLAPFDELNVVTSTSGGSGGGLNDTILDDLKKYVDSYDMLAGYTDELKKKAQQLKKPAEKILKILASVLGASVIGKAVVGIAKIIKSVGDFTKKVKDLKIVKTVSDYFKKGAGNVKTFVDALKNGSTLAGAFKTAFGTLGGIITGIGAALGSFFATSNSIGDALEGTKNWNIALGEAVGWTSAFAAAAGLLIGPVGVIAAIGGGIAGAAYEYGKFKDAEREAANQLKVHKDMYDGYGVSVEDLGKKLLNSYKYIGGEVDKIDTYKQKYDESKTSVDNARDALDLFIQSIGLQDDAMSKTQWTEYNTRYEQLRDAINETAEANKLYGTNLIKTYGRISGASAESTASQIADYKALVSAQSGMELEYLEREKKINESYLTGKISASEYHEQMFNLKKEYGLIANDAGAAAGVIDSFNDKITDIDYTNLTSGELKKYFEEIKTGSSDAISKLEDMRKKVSEGYDSEISYWQQRVDNYKSFGSEMTDDMKKHLAEAEGNVEKYKTLQDTATKSFNTAITDISQQTKDTMVLIYADLIKNGADTSKEFEGVVGEVEETLKSLSETDLSEGGKESLLTYLAGVSGQLNSTQFRTKYLKVWDVIGKDGMNEVAKAIEKGKIPLADSTFDTFTEFGKAWNKWKVNEFPTVNENIRKSMGTVGKSVVEGYEQGMKEKFSKEEWNTVTSKIGKDSVNKTREILDSHSPSRVFASLGRDTVEGYALGIKDAAPRATNAVKKLAEDSVKAMDNVKLSLNIDTNVEKSFNSILDKVQKFCNKWTSAINTLVKNMKNTMNGVTINADGKVSYTKMPTVTVSKFEDGGYPTSGELFFANENGRAEFITSIGNKTAVANQDQMVQALTNAIMAGFAMTAPRSESKQPINVNIGDRQVYNGVVDYQNRQSDRYGTTTTLNI